MMGHSCLVYLSAEVADNARSFITKWSDLLPEWLIAFVAI